MSIASDPFHTGELEAQTRAGVKGMARIAGGAFKPELTERHLTFLAQLPFLVVAGADGRGRHWVTLLEGPEGFVRAPDERTLESDAQLLPDDPLHSAFDTQSNAGILGIDLSKRHRLRLNGALLRKDTGLRMQIQQAFANCPQYIHKRRWQRVANDARQQAARASKLNTRQISFVRRADTLFMGTGQLADRNAVSSGFDASHKGGAAGFVSVLDGGHLRIPDYAGNNYFNSVGNLLRNPAIGLVFVDFTSGTLLHVSGQARVNWTPEPTDDPDARRTIDVTISSVVERPSALSLRWLEDTKTHGLGTDTG